MRSKILWWIITGALAAGLGYWAQRRAIPGGIFLASMTVAVAAGLIRPSHPQIARPVVMVILAVIGTMLGISIRPDALPVLLLHFPAIFGAICVTIAVSLISAIVLPKISSMNQETAAMGTLPGGASVMVMLSIGTKADTKIVALMQYTRLILVVAVTSLVASFIIHHVPEASQGTHFQTPVIIHSWTDFLLTPLVAILGVIVARLTRLPNAILLGPMLSCILVSAASPLHLILPAWIIWIAYILMGFYVGLLFDRESLIQSRRLLPLLVANVLVLMGSCAAIGLSFARITHATLLSGYLATSPGGGDSISIIALGSGADIALVFTVQIFRGLLLASIGPYLAKSIVHITRKRTQD